MWSISRPTNRWLLSLPKTMAWQANSKSLVCLTSQKLISKLESARTNSNGDRYNEIINHAIEAKHFSINKQFILGCHEAGMVLADANIICSAMNLPFTFRSWSTQGNCGVLEKLGGKAEGAATSPSCNERGVPGKNTSYTQCAWTGRLGWQRTWFSVVEPSYWHGPLVCTQYALTHH